MSLYAFVCVFECLCVTCANEYTKGSPKKPCFLVLLFSSSTDSLLTGFIPSYPGESRFSDPWRQCREGPLKAAPTQMGRWTLAANEKRTQHLTHTGWNFTSVLELPLSGYLGGTDIGVSLYKKKNWPWGARWNSLPVALCNQGVLCSTQHSALQQSPALGALHPCFDSIFAQFPESPKIVKFRSAKIYVNVWI